jgi:calcineurin-like phosphoesterase family protein
MKFWIIADMHLGHKKLIEDKLRPEGYSDKILNNIRKTVGIHDILIDLGDVCFEDCGDWHAKLEHLPGKKWLIRGNHDKQTLSWYICHGWDMICDSLFLEIFGKRILFSHVPMKDSGYDINIHGHFHNFSMETVEKIEPDLFKILTPKHYLVSLEKSHYQPISLEYICKHLHQ